MLGVGARVDAHAAAQRLAARALARSALADLYGQAGGAARATVRRISRDVPALVVAGLLASITAAEPSYAGDVRRAARAAAPAVRLVGLEARAHISTDDGAGGASALPARAERARRARVVAGAAVSRVGRRDELAAAEPAQVRLTVAVVVHALAAPGGEGVRDAAADAHVDLCRRYTVPVVGGWAVAARHAPRRTDSPSARDLDAEP